MRGQVTGFAIIGVLLLLAVTALIWVSRPAAIVPGETSGPSLDVESCIEQEAITTIGDIALAGGTDPEGSSSLRKRVTSGAYAGRDVWVALGDMPPHAGYGVGPSETHYLSSEARTSHNHFPMFASDILFARSTSSTLTELLTPAIEGCGAVGVETITYSDTTVTIQASVEEDGASPYDLTVTLPIPIRSYHHIMRSVLEKESTDARFLIATHEPSGDYTISLEANVNDYNDSLVILTSNRPLLGSQPLRYLALIENRAPVFLADPEDYTSCVDVDSALSDGDLIDPDDEHTPEVDACNLDADTNTLEIVITSGGVDYTIEVDL